GLEAQPGDPRPGRGEERAAGGQRHGEEEDRVGCRCDRSGGGGVRRTWSGGTGEADLGRGGLPHRGSQPSSCLARSFILSGVQRGSWTMSTVTTWSDSCRSTCCWRYEPSGQIGVVVVITTRTRDPS